MWQVRDRNSSDEWRDVTCAFYWDMGRLHVCWPGQSQPAVYTLGNSRWRTPASKLNVLAGTHRLRANISAEAA